MKGLKLIFGMCFLSLTVGTFAFASQKPEPTWKGTIPVIGVHTADELKTMAKVTQEDAQKTALAAVQGAEADKTAGEGKLEVENGFLIWSFDIKVKDKAGADEVLVDAGDGKMLANSHEPLATEAKVKVEAGKP